MLYLTGAVPANPVLRESLKDAGVGVMVVCRNDSAGMSHWISQFNLWAFDNGGFTEIGRANCSTQRFYRKLDSLPRESCLFATAPDVYGDGEETLRLSLDVLPRLRGLGYRAAFVAQPGVPEYPWDEFDCLFMGGHDEFKRTEGSRLLREAKRRGKWCHMGRVNSAKQFIWARERGYDSADGTCVAFAPDINSRKVTRWAKSARQLTLEDIA